jgi:two-component system sensor histidine kinase KdpD
LEAGAAEPRREWTSVEDLIRTSLSELAAGPEEFSLSIDSELPLVSVDPVQMERAFVNVLENARRHSGGHPVSVRARAVRGLVRSPHRLPASADGPAEAEGEGQSRPAGGRVIVRIVDRGPGIPPAQLERVFEPFYRAGTASGGHRGSGLGLAIARGFTQASAGSLHVESLPGQGASFVFELPLREDAADRRTGDAAGQGQLAGDPAQAEAPTLAPPPSERTPGA